MTPPSSSTDPLVEVLATRLRRMDLVAWQRIASWSEQVKLSFEDLRLLLALTMADGPPAATEIAELSGLPLGAVYRAIGKLRSRGYLREERRRYALTEQGDDLVATLDSAHREGIQAYVDDLDANERRALDEAFGIDR
jgi:DNA-binding MarR family transcriptional regulator